MRLGQRIDQNPNLVATPQQGRCRLRQAVRVNQARGRYGRPDFVRRRRCLDDFVDAPGDGTEDSLRVVPIIHLDRLAIARQHLQPFQPQVRFPWAVLDQDRQQVQALLLSLAQEIRNLFLHAEGRSKEASADQTDGETRPCHRCLDRLIPVFALFDAAVVPHVQRHRLPERPQLNEQEVLPGFVAMRIADENGILVAHISLCSGAVCQ